MRWLLSLVALFALSACHAAPPAESHGSIANLAVIDHVIGQGAQAKPGMTVQVQYTGWLYDDRAPNKHGKEFDSSLHGSGPFSFQLGAGEVIQGWDLGVAGMKVGGSRTLLIPAAMGYGSQGAGDDIPPDASLVFDVKLVGVKS